MDRPFFPLFVDLSEKRILVVGAGSIASRRAAAILPFAGRVTVVAPEVCGELEARGEAGEITLHRRCFGEADLEGAGLVLAATNDAELNGRIGALARARGIPVNVSSDKALCDFYFPGVARRGDLVVGVTASGTDHAASRRVTQAVRRLLEEGGEPV